jgi:hypothetical protein
VSADNHPDLVKVTEIFLIPSSFLVAAIGTADTNVHRAVVSGLGFVISLLWAMCSREAMADAVHEKRPRRMHILNWLPALFGIIWLASTVLHAALWRHPIGSGFLGPK